MRTDDELCDFFAELCRRARKKYGLVDRLAPEQVDGFIEQVADLIPPAEGLTPEEKDRLGELMVWAANLSMRMPVPGFEFLGGSIPFFVAYGYLPKFKVWRDE
jgi:hypothetical protein